MSQDTPRIEVRNLVTLIDTPRGVVEPVSGITLSVAPGETLGIVGETGSGKSVFVRSLMGLMPPGARYGQGSQVRIGPHEMTRLSPGQLRNIWGREIGLIPQDPATSLNPVRRIGAQLMDCILRDPNIAPSQRRARAVELLSLVGISDPERRLEVYPHQMSGGMRQRVLIAIAIALSPGVLIADEPTTALDVTIQRQVLDLIQRLQEEVQTSVLLVSHDLAVVAGRSHRVGVMYSGRLVELLDTASLLAGPRHPYTRGLLNSQAHHAPAREDLPTIPGEPPDIRNRPPGCPFAPRCPRASALCQARMPEFTPLSPQGATGFACHHPFEAGAQTSAAPVLRSVS
ncbi:ABC transporter ATP-binding protein [Falsigemmobacter intermedius]|uniref:ABC transporter ATP-binding protein n=1 Tax=Falsigemmobacter intermedius TaxID=1553448 RepID=A0A451GHD4_9RHOB|nr:ABC transporter ATP-binding protein [Falsigemmobacter intermedius]RWY37668.1 ABC transporter ATP-binding protein [Falsigemmobacter intermedius]